MQFMTFHPSRTSNFAVKKVERVIVSPARRFALSEWFDE